MALGTSEEATPKNPGSLVPRNRTGRKRRQMAAVDEAITPPRGGRLGLSRPSRETPQNKAKRTEEGRAEKSQVLRISLRPRSQLHPQPRPLQAFSFTRASKSTPLKNKTKQNTLVCKLKGDHFLSLAETVLADSRQHRDHDACLPMWLQWVLRSFSRRHRDSLGAENPS